eukprot:CCRYP_011049-RA/>CCRYP_011049-RA protein AED:0.19 eAED:0.21 QI:0/0/0/1/1/1/3/0/208
MEDASDSLLNIAENALAIRDDGDINVPSVVSLGALVVRTNPNEGALVSSSGRRIPIRKELGLPIVATQQYTKVLGPTIPYAFADPKHIGTLVPVCEKKNFSMMTPECSEHLSSLGKTSFLLVGIEAHVCLEQTALDLLIQEHDVHIMLTSQQKYDRDMALRRMESRGAWLTSAQSAAFLLLGSADHPNFKAVSMLVKDHMKLKNEFNE